MQFVKIKSLELINVWECKCSIYSKINVLFSKLIQHNDMPIAPSVVVPIGWQRTFLCLLLYFCVCVFVCNSDCFYLTYWRPCFFFFFLYLGYIFNMAISVVTMWRVASCYGFFEFGQLDISIDVKGLLKQPCIQIFNVFGNRELKTRFLHLSLIT